MKNRILKLTLHVCFGMYVSGQHCLEEYRIKLETCVYTTIK